MNIKDKTNAKNSNDGNNNELTELIAVNLANAAADKHATQEEVAKKVSNRGCEVSQTTVNRLFSGKKEQYASFIKAFCEAYNVSADDILGINKNAISCQKITPFIVLSNLILLLNQFNFNIEFNSDYSKAMLTTSNIHMINFLFPIRESKNATMEQIDYFCKSYQLLMLAKGFSSGKELYIIEEMNKLYTAKQENPSLNIDDYLRNEKKQLHENLEFADLSPEEIYAKKWDRLSMKEKEKETANLLQKYLKDKNNNTNNGESNNN